MRWYALLVQADGAAVVSLEPLIRIISISIIIVLLLLLSLSLQLLLLIIIVIVIVISCANIVVVIIIITSIISLEPAARVLRAEEVGAVRRPALVDDLYHNI